MRASLIAPALTIWLVVGAATCLLLTAPWYIGAGVGFVAAAITYWLWPKLAAIPPWFLHILTAAIAATTFLMAVPTFVRWFAGFSVALELYTAARLYSRRNEPEPLDPRV